MDFRINDFQFSLTFINILKIIQCYNFDKHLYMSGKNHPLSQAQQVDRESYEQQIMQALTQLRNNEKKQGNQIEQLHSILDNLPEHQEEEEDHPTPPKRENQDSSKPLPTKKICPNHQIDEQDEEKISIRGNSLSFMGYQSISLEMPSSMRQENEQEDYQGDNPTIRAFKEKIQEKKRYLEQLEKKNQILRHENRVNSFQSQKQKQKQKQIMKSFIKNDYALKIYRFGISNQRQQHEAKNVSQTQYLNYLNEKIEVLKGEKSKKKKIHDEESNFFLEDYNPERIVYIKQWRKKIETAKNSFEKQFSKMKVKFISPIQQTYYQIPPSFVQLLKKQEKLSNYLPLYSWSSSEFLKDGEPIELKMLNLETLKHQNTLMVVYPKLMKRQRREELGKRFTILFERSQNLHQSKLIQIFNPYSLCLRTSEEWIVLSRICWQTERKCSLKDFLGRYECLNQTIARYIIKFCLKAHEEVKAKLSNQQIIILPENIIFNDRHDIRIDNWIYNQTLMFHEYRDSQKFEQKYLFYLPPEFLQQGNSQFFGSLICWTMGVIFFEIIYGKKPFNNYLSDSKEFYILHELIFPSKPQLSDQAKNFIRYCLKKPEERISLSNALKLQYFQNSK